MNSTSSTTIGVPYAEAGVSDAGRATATCPECGQVFEASTSKAAVRMYAKHFEAAHA